MSQLSEIIEKGSAELGVALREGAVDLFEGYYEHLTVQSRIHNLTAITGIEDTARLHFLDSLAVLGVRGLKNARVLDIGSGAGFPGVPLKIAEPTILLTLLDATKKRVGFLRELCERLGQSDVTCLHARAEEAAHSSELRESFDIVLSRAVARLNVLCELSLPYAKVGGYFLAMKGIESSDEERESAAAAAALGAELCAPYDYELPGTGITRRVIVFRKIVTTPAEYPRRYARIQKSPL